MAIHSVYGSINLSHTARCANWDSILVSTTEEDDLVRFDRLWDTLEDWKLQAIYP